MVAESRSMSFDLLSEKGAVFQAKWPGKCAGCGEPFASGDLVAFGGKDTIMAEACCGDDPGLVAHDDHNNEPMPQVMPRGRTAHDKCPTCFQVPASNGACGCW